MNGNPENLDQQVTTKKGGGNEEKPSKFCYRVSTLGEFLDDQ